MTRCLPLLLLLLGSCAPPSAGGERAAPDAPAAFDERAAARRRVATLERQVVEDQERVREAQLAHDATRDQYLTLRDAAAAQLRSDEVARGTARDSEPYQALVRNLVSAADELERHDGSSPELRVTLGRLADLMQAAEVRPADADEAARWERYLADARDQSLALRPTNAVAAAAARRLVDAFARVRWFWEDFDQDRAAERAALPGDDQRARRKLAEASQRHQRARDELEDAKRALREHESALSQARAASQNTRANPR